MKQKNIFFILAVLFFHVGVYGQTKSSILSQADKSMAEKNYYDALNKYKEALEFDVEDVQVMHKLAESGRLFNSFKIAAEYYTKVLEHNDNNLFPLAGYWLGQVKQRMGDYDGARVAYNTYKSERGGEDAYYSAIADKEIKACEWAINQVNHPVKGTTITRLGNDVNTEFSEFAPVSMGDKFMFSSMRFPNMENTTLPKKYISNILESNRGSQPKLMEQAAFRKGGQSVGNLAYSSDKKSAYFTICDHLNYHDTRCDIYRCTIDEKGNFGEAVKCPESINSSSSSQTHPNIGFNTELSKDVLYFSSNRTGGKGGYDLWYSVIDKEGNYSEPMNLGSLNTAQDDISPSFDSQSRTMYYSSNGHLGLGGFDVYSVRQLTGGWGTIKNMGSPLNSSYDDIYFAKGAKPKEYFLASNRTGAKYIDDLNEACCLDIFTAHIESCDINLKTLVYETGTNIDLNNSTIKLYDLQDPKATPLIVQTGDSNLGEFPIQCDREYKLEVSKPGYIPASVVFMSTKPGEATDMVKKIYLTPEAVKLDVMTFDKKTKQELTGCTVTFLDLDSLGFQPVIINNLPGNSQQFEVVRCHRYRITVSKPGYAQTTNEVKIDCKANGIITEKVYLNKILNSMLPLVLYFYNDRPNPRSNSKTTNLSYFQTFAAYYPKKAEFIRNYLRLTTKDNTDLSAKINMENFFDFEIKGGKEKLELFLNILETELSQGKIFDIVLKGFASPRANNDYNYNLSQRRVRSVENEFSRYKKGVLLKYIKNGSLKISQEQYGEDTAPKSIIDDISDMRSIYMIDASRERRVEIIEVR